MIEDDPELKRMQNGTEGAAMDGALTQLSEKRGCRRNA